MTHTSVAADHFAEGGFRVGSVISRSASLLSRHFLTFFVVTVIVYSPIFLLASTRTAEPTDLDQALSLFAGILSGSFLKIVLGTLGQAVILHAAFQDMRHRPVRLAESLNVALRRFLPIIGLALLVGFLMMLGLMLLIIPGLILYTIWFVWLPACVVERRGLWTSLRRSQELTKGYRWKLFGLALLLIIVSLGGSLIAYGLAAVAGPIAGLIGRLIWTGTWAAFAAVVVAVTYHDLRVAKEGVDIEQIAAVFD